MAASMPSFVQRLMRPFTSSTKMSLNPESTSQVVPENAQKCTIAAGCFWGVEHLFRKTFTDKGLIDAQVGYIGGDSKNPGYRAVCTGKTGHAEALQVTFDPTQVTYASLLEFFYRMHDPTTKDRQGMDTGSQYRSGIFYHSQEQKEVAESVTAKAQEQWYKEKKITTVIQEAGEWFTAEAYHQRYSELNEGAYHCAAHFVRNFAPLK